MYQARVSSFLVASTTLINSKSFTRRSYSTIRSTGLFHGYLTISSNFQKSKILSRQSRAIATLYNSKNLRETFVFQPSSQKNENPPFSPEIFPAHSDNSSDTAQEKKPSLVILIGWWNCKPQNLHKYVSLYIDKLHIDTLSHIPPFYHVFLPWTILKDTNLLAKELIRDWVERGKPDNVGFHVFSNNGTYHYAMICEMIRQIANDPSINPEISPDEARSFLDSVKSCVIDSAPSPLFEKHIALGIIGGLLHKTNLMRTKATSTDPPRIEPHPFLMSCLALFFYLPFTKKYQAFAHKTLDDIPGGIFDGRNIKYLFLYGPGDQIVLEDDVTEFMQRLKNRRGDFHEKGVLRIIGKRFGGGSEHVQHFMKYPEEYMKALKSFYGFK